ncbi:MAG TPA: DUF6186 family protein [Acidimicrobiales bacterium]|nr:DUF6186 family protein [Acidimicrobiales bacterium]
MTWRALTFLVWGALLVAILACETAAWASRGRLPRLGDVLARVMAPRGGRIVVILAWMWLGWHAFAR